MSLDDNFPLRQAILNNELETVKQFVQDGTDINLAAADGTTLVFLAAEHGHDEILKFLIENHADINKAQNDGTSPLYVAARNNHLDVVQLLIENKVNINIGSGRGNQTPLHAALEYAVNFEGDDFNRYFTIIELLVNNGADITALDENGITPLKLAEGNEKITQLFKKQTNSQENSINIDALLKPLQTKINDRLHKFPKAKEEAQNIIDALQIAAREAKDPTEFVEKCQKIFAKSPTTELKQHRKTLGLFFSVIKKFFVTLKKKLAKEDTTNHPFFDTRTDSKTILDDLEKTLCPKPEETQFKAKG